LASWGIPPHPPCGWHLLQANNFCRRARMGLLRSWRQFDDGRRV